MEVTAGSISSGCRVGIVSRGDGGNCIRAMFLLPLPKTFHFDDAILCNHIAGVCQLPSISSAVSVTVENRNRGFF